VDEDQNPQGQERETRQNLDALRSLLKTPGWVLLREIIQEELTRREQFILYTPTSSSEEAFLREFLKGEASGWKFLIDLPDMQIESLETVKELFRRQREEREALIEEEENSE
jgi:hypothetical protein